MVIRHLGHHAFNICLHGHHALQGMKNAFCHLISVRAISFLVQVYPPPPPWFRLYRQDADGSAERPFPPHPPAVIAGEFQMFGRTESVWSFPVSDLVCMEVLVFQYQNRKPGSWVCFYGTWSIIRQCSWLALQIAGMLILLMFRRRKRGCLP